MAAIPESALRALTKAVEITFEEMAFSEVDIIEAGVERKYTAGDSIQAGLAITAPFSAWIDLRMPRKLAEQITESVCMAAGGCVGSEEMNDVLAEMVNVIAGLFLKEFLPPDKSYSLDIPTVGKKPPPSKGKDRAAIFIEVEGSPVTITISGKDIIN